MRYGPMTQYGDAGMFGAVLHVLVIIILILLIVALVRRLFSRDPMWHRWGRMGMMGGGHNSSLEILKERYAKGAITKQEFDQMKKDLE
jgi:putative membrane protein